MIARCFSLWRFAQKAQPGTTLSLKNFLGAATFAGTMEMSAYQTLVVGTDGSDTSLRAVDHAAAVAAENNAKLIIAMAHLPEVDKGGWGRPGRPDRVIDPRAEVVLRGDGDYKMHGEAPVYEILREARDRARAAGAKNIETRPILGDPVHGAIPPRQGG